MYQSVLNSLINSYSAKLSGENFITLGTKKDCWADIQRGANQISFGKEIAEGVTSVVLNPSLKKIKSCNSLDFLPKTVTYIEIPLPLVPLLKYEETPNIRHLIVRYLEDYDDLELNFNTIGLSKNFPIESFTFNEEHHNSSVLWYQTNINLEEYENLKFVSLNIDNTKDCTWKVSQLNKTKYFVLIAQSQDLLDFVPSGAELLSLSCNENEFKFDKLSNFSNLKMLQISSSKSYFDCSLLQNLSLEEICLLDIKKVLNANKLLDIESLQRLKIINCRNPIKSKQKQDFYSKNYESLYIEYS